MLLTQDELQSLVEVKHRSPHRLLGMHPLGDGSGLVARYAVVNRKLAGMDNDGEMDSQRLRELCNDVVALRSAVENRAGTTRMRPAEDRREDRSCDKFVGMPLKSEYDGDSHE